MVANPQLIEYVHTGIDTIIKLKLLTVPALPCPADSAANGSHRKTVRNPARAAKSVIGAWLKIDEP